MKTEHQLDLPRRLQIELSAIVQAQTDASGGEVDAARLWEIFAHAYLPASDPAKAWGRYALRGMRQQSEVDGAARLSVDVTDRGEPRVLEGLGNGPIDALVEALREDGIAVRVLDYAEHALSEGGDARAAAFVECEVGDRVLWGVGVDPNTVVASLRAVLSAVNRAL